MKKCIYFILAGMALTLGAHSQTNPKLAVKVYKRDTLFNCIAADSLGNVYAASSQKGIFKFDGSQWKDWTGGNGSVGLRKCFMKHMAGAKEGVWLTHSGFTLSVTGAGPSTFYANATGGVEYIPAAHPAQRVKYQGRAILTRRLTQGPSTKSGLAIAIDKNGTVWSAANYADSQRYFYFDGITTTPDRYYYSPGGLTFKTATGAGFDTVVNGMPWPAGINVSIGTDGKTDTWSIGKRRVARAVGVINSINEVWVSVDSMQAAGETFSNCILRYSLSGDYLGKIDNSGTGLPMGPGTGYIGATAIHEDVKGRIWLGFNKGIGVKDSTGNWTYIPNPPLLPANPQIRPNAISSNKNGEVYFGTLNGLYVYRCVNGSYTNDTSYKLFTTADSLPSNNILGITVDKPGNIWLATASGLAKINKGGLLAYNINNEYANIGNRATTAGYFSGTERLLSVCTWCDDYNTIQIAADSSEATLFTYDYDGADWDKYIFRIKEANGDNSQAAKDKYGYFDLAKRKYDPGLRRIEWKYHHPVYLNPNDLDADGRGKTYTFELFDSYSGVPVSYSTNKLQKLKIVYPPVILIHGVWSNSALTYGTTPDKPMPGITSDGLYNFLLSSGVYKDYQVEKPDHHVYIDKNTFTKEKTIGQLTQEQVLKKQIELFLSRCASRELSAGKVDLVAHSRGGLLTRSYIHDASYMNNINKVITVNTPHFGSQGGDAALDKRKLYYFTAPNAFVELGSLLGSPVLDPADDINGAYDLRVCSQLIKNLNNPSNVSKNQVPSHAITSKLSFASAKLDEMLAAPGSNSGAFGIWLRMSNMVSGALTLPKDALVDLFLRKLYYGGPNDSYNGDSDFLVSITSGLGGQNPGTTGTYLSTNLGHSDALPKSKARFFIPTPRGVLFNSETHNKIMSLLKEKSTNTGVFSKGFPNPVQLTYNYLDYAAYPADNTCPGEGVIYPSTGTNVTADPDTTKMVDVTITNLPTNGYKDFDTVKIQVNGGSNVKGILATVTTANQEPFSYAVENTNQASFNYLVPRGVVGDIFVTAYGFDNQSLPYSIDTASGKTVFPAGIVLDSIRIINKIDLSVYKSDSMVVAVRAYYNDTTRDITYKTGITYAFEEGNAAAAKYGFKGVNVGFDRLFVTYQGKRDTAYVEILDKLVSISPIPVTFNDIYAKYRNGAIDVSWSTESELNNKFFEVQRSTDGTHFTTFATVPGKVFSSTTSWYNATDYGFSPGRNFYRIKQVDLDGNFKVSKVVMVIVKDKNTVLLYPNPAHTEVYVAIGTQVNAKTLRVVNTMGQPVMTRTVSGNGQTVNIGISQLPAGVYFTELFNGNNESVWRGTFVKE